VVWLILALAVAVIVKLKSDHMFTINVNCILFYIGIFVLINSLVVSEMMP